MPPQQPARAAQLGRATSTCTEEGRREGAAAARRGRHAHGGLTFIQPFIAPTALCPIRGPNSNDTLPVTPLLRGMWQ